MKEGLIDLADVVVDLSIYPREKWVSATVNAYIDAIKGGAKFPQIILEESTNRLLDGLHRIKAHQKYAEMYREKKGNTNSDDTDPIENWSEPVQKIVAIWHVIPDEIPDKLYAASLNSKHGDRIKPAEMRTLTREIYQSNPDFKLKTVKEFLDLSIGTVHGYVADILAQRKEEQKMTALRLHLLGRTQEEIGDVVGMSQQNIANFLQGFSELKKMVKNLIAEGHPHTDIAKRYNMPLILVWALDLADRSDEQRMERLKIKVQPYDVWNFNGVNDLFGAQYPGRIPGDLIAHVLYFFTEPSAMVVDPMVGGGTTLDVCLALGRKCYGYDIENRYARSDVIEHNLKDGWHNRLKKADMIFWDPPYFEKMDEGYGEESISKLSREEYLEFFGQRFAEAAKVTKKGTKLAFLMSDWDDNTGDREGIFLWDYSQLIKDAGWHILRHIQTPLPTQQVHADIVNKFRKARRLARLERYLFIAERR